MLRGNQPIIRMMMNRGRHLQRKFSSQGNNNSGRNAYQEKQRNRNRNVVYYTSALTVFVFGMSYAAVPLYKVFCQITGFGGTTQQADVAVRPITVKPVKNKDNDDNAPPALITVEFVSNTHNDMPWEFRPSQSALRVLPGETALAFYTAKNTRPYPVTGVATYSVHPSSAAVYFSKIQCFCFEEQRLSANEQVDMPVFFYVDPEILSNPVTTDVRNITLSYTFFKTGDEKPTPAPSTASTVAVSTEKR